MSRSAESSAVQARRMPSWLLATALYAVLVGYLTVRDFGATAYDDSYFFKRFALHMLDHGVFAWNVDDGPIFGSTSQLFQIIATAVTAVTRTHFVIGIRVVSAVALCGCGASLFRWCARASAVPIGAQAVALLALGSPIVLGTVTTGMETAVTLALLAVVLTRLFPARGDESKPVASWMAAVLTVVVYLCRPDAAVLPAAAFVIDRLLRGDKPVAYFGWLAAFMVLVWVGSWAYYGTPLPLSFYMKTLALQNYGAHMVGLGWHEKQLHFGAMLAFSIPLLWIIIRSGAVAARGTTLSLLLASACLWGYHLASTNESMGYRARFYVPAIVPLAMAAARSWDGFAARSQRWPTLVLLAGWTFGIAWAYGARAIPSHEEFFIGRIPWPAYAASIVAGAALLLMPRRAPPWAATVVVFGGLMAGLIGWKPPGATHAPSDLQIMRRHSRQVTTARGVFDVARCLRRDGTVYHSEMGVTGLILIDRRVVDLAGILSRGPGIGRERFDDYCRIDKPQAIFLPHRNYRTLNAEIRASDCFADYRRAIDKSSSPLHVRSDLFDPFMRCATETHRWRNGPSE